ncbi:MAG: TetR/AcrR family transcriptional regulator [Oscillospiraceae bacterium]
MSETRQDIRVTKTQRALTSALMALLSRQDFQKISVGDICQEALVSRSTFYAHFQDKYDLLRFSLGVFREQMEADCAEKSPLSCFASVLHHIKDNSRIFRNLFGGEPERELLEMLESFFGERFRAMLPADTSDALRELTASFYTHGIAGTIAWWVRGGFSLSPEEMADAQFRLLAGNTALERLREA